MPLVLNGEVEITDAFVSSEVTVISGGQVHLENSFITTLTVTDSGTDLNVDASNCRFTTVTLTGLNGISYAVFRGCSVTSRFIASGSTNIDADLNIRSTTNSSAVDVDTCTMIRMTGAVRHTGNATCVRWDDVVASELDMLVIPGGDGQHLRRRLFGRGMRSGCPPRFSEGGCVLRSQPEIRAGGGCGVFAHRLVHADFGGADGGYQQSGRRTTHRALRVVE